MAKRRMGMITFLFLVCLCLMPCSAQAVSTSDAAEPILSEKECSLTLSYVCEGRAFSDMPVKLYRIAEVSAEVQYTLTSPFLTSGLVLNGIQSVGEWEVIRSTLEAHILSNRIEAELTAGTDQAGQVHFESLKPGLYLVTAGRGEQDGLRCLFGSALIALPGLGVDGLWQYETAVVSKAEVLPPPQDDPDPEKDLQFKVLKLWKGENSQSARPKSIEAEIFRDGASYQTVTLSEDNHWSYTWTAEDDGADWTVVERSVPEGYTMTVEERATTFLLTNTRIQEELPSVEPPLEELPPEVSAEKDHAQEDAPETGDTPHILLYTVLMYASGIGLILLGITGKKKRT